MTINDGKDILKDAMYTFYQVMICIAAVALLVGGFIGTIALMISIVAKVGCMIAIPMIIVVGCFIGSIIFALIRHYF